MRAYLTRLALVLASMVLAVLANIIALGAALLGLDRAWRVAIANDQAMNAALVGYAGSEDETISSRAGKAQRRGKAWGCVLCRLLDAIDPGHCADSVEDDEGLRS